MQLLLELNGGQFENAKIKDESAKLRFRLSAEAILCKTI